MSKKRRKKSQYQLEMEAFQNLIRQKEDEIENGVHMYAPLFHITHPKCVFLFCLINDKGIKDEHGFSRNLIEINIDGWEGDGLKAQWVLNYLKHLEKEGLLEVISNETNSYLKTIKLNWDIAIEKIKKKISRQ